MRPLFIVNCKQDGQLAPSFHLVQKWIQPGLVHDIWLGLINCVSSLAILLGLVHLFYSILCHQSLWVISPYHSSLLQAIDCIQVHSHVQFCCFGKFVSGEDLVVVNLLWIGTMHIHWVTLVVKCHVPKDSFVTLLFLMLAVFHVSVVWLDIKVVLCDCYVIFFFFFRLLLQLLLQEASHSAFTVFCMLLLSIFLVNYLPVTLSMASFLGVNFYYDSSLISKWKGWNRSDIYSDMSSLTTLLRLPASILTFLTPPSLVERLD